MNKYEEKTFENELKRIIFSYSKEGIKSIYPERTKKRRKNEYEKLATQLNLLKQLKVNELKKEENNKSQEKIEVIKTIYTEEDKDFLKQAIINNELTIFDLTFEEAIMLGFTGEEYRRIQRKVASEFELSKKEKEEFDYKLSKMNSPTPNIEYTLYKQIKKK